MKKIICSVFLMAIFTASAQNVQKIMIENDCVSRTIIVEANHIRSSAFLLKGDSDNFIKKSKDFAFTINDKAYSGLSDWDVLKTKQEKLKTGECLTTLVLKEKSNAPQVEITLHYATYPHLPLIRKWIEFTNIGEKDVKLEDLNIEDLQTTLFSVHSVVYTNYARMKHLMKYEGDWDDPVIVVHEINTRRGLALGNEAPMVLKRSAYHTEDNNIQIGLRHKKDAYAFRKWLKPGQKWMSTKTFICPYHNQSDGFQVVNNQVNRFVTNFMGTRIEQVKHKPTFVYNTWYPFKSFINDELVRSVAKAASECGIQEFVIDDGWQYNVNKQSALKGAGQNYGDWLVDLNKFPQGLKPTFDYIKSLGMKPGLWISLASANRDSKVFKEHPEWFVRDAKGDFANLHNKKNIGMLTASFGTGWVDYIKGVILGLVNDYGLEYAKLDLAVVTSAYLNETSFTGSYATDQPDYRDHAESFIVFYENLLKLFDELHAEAPQLFIDCTFETAGKAQLMDYAIAKHAEGNWLSNFVAPAPYGSLRVRQMAWWRSPAVPASSLVIGNMAMDDPNFELTLKSMIGTLPIVLGDPRKLSIEKRAQIHQWANWMKAMQTKYDYMSFRKDLKGYGEPREGFWDGWQRINFNTHEGGIVGIFRQDAAEKKRCIVVDDLIPNALYKVKQAPKGTVIVTLSGEQLMKDGFNVSLEKRYDGAIFEIEKQR